MAASPKTESYARLDQLKTRWFDLKDGGLYIAPELRRLNVSPEDAELIAGNVQLELMAASLGRVS